MPEKIMRVRWDEGSAFTKSRKTPGDYSALTRDSESMELGQVTLSEIPEEELSSSPVYIFVNQESDERDETAEAVAALIMLGILIAVEKASPHVRQWLKDSAVPAMAASRGRISKAIRRGKRSSDTDIAVVLELATTESATAVVATADTGPKVRMSAAEWKERFRLMLLAGAFQEEQWRRLSTARVVDGDDLVDVQKTMENLSPRQVAEGMRLALDANQSVLDEETSVAMRRIFAGVRVEDGRHALSRGDQPN